MSFVFAIRDYVDFLNNWYDSLAGNINLQGFIQQSLIYIFESFKYIIFYVISFQWFRDIAYLPILVPQISLSLFKENYILEHTSVLNIFNFLEIPSYQTNKLFVGFLNSFFISLPFSCSHFLSARRLLVQGIPAGIASGFGTIIGQTWFLICVIFGLRVFLIPWFALEPLNYFLGVLLLLITVYNLAHEKTLYIVGKDETKKLIKFFSLNFLLAWCEQSSIFQHFSNLNFSAEPSLLETVIPSNELNSFLINGSYIVGFFIGSCFFTFLFGYFALYLRQYWLEIASIGASKLINQVNVCLMTLILSFSFASIPYYGIDYLLMNSLGFIPQEKNLQNTVFSPNTVRDVEYFISPQIGDLSREADTTSFDRGFYLNQQDLKSFEDLNYQGEYAWTAKADRRGSVLGNRYGNLLPGFSRLLGKDSSIDKVNESESQISKKDFNKIIRKKPNEPSSEKTEIVEWDDSFIKNKRSKLGDFYERISEDENLEETFFKTFNIGLSPFFQADSQEIPPVEKLLKKKFYDNPLYKSLLTLDIDSFISRQPKKYSLNSTEEFELFKKRQMLSNYYDTLREYSSLPNSSEFFDVFHGSKSYADRVYNQQFKGTLKVVRRLFSIAVDNEQNPEQNTVLKFDQPLFTQKEEKNFIGHEELNHLERKNNANNNQLTFLELTKPKPLYAGWDENQRTLIITNRFLDRSLATTKLNLKSLKEKDTQTEISFTAWPLSKITLDKSKTKLNIPYNVMFESDSDPKNKLMIEASKELMANEMFKDWEMTTWPKNIGPRTNDPSNLVDSIIPENRGGFIWPGSEKLKFQIKNLKI